MGDWAKHEMGRASLPQKCFLFAGTTPEKQKEKVLSKFDKYKNIRQKVLLTDDTEKTRLFYEANGFEAANKLNLVSYIIINN